MQSTPSIGSTTATPSPNLLQTLPSAPLPLSQSGPLAVNPSAVIGPATQPQLPQSRHESIFRFRSERAQWLALLAIVLSLVALIVAWIYSSDAQELAEWEAEKDYQQYCSDLKARIPSACHLNVGNLALVVFAGSALGLCGYRESDTAAATWP